MQIKTKAASIRQFLPQDRGEHLYDLSLAKEGGVPQVHLNFRIQEKQQRHFYLEQAAPLSMHFSLKDSESGPVVWVKNMSFYRLRDALIIWGEKVIKVGTVPERREIQVQASKVSASVEMDRIKRALLEAAKGFLHDGVLLGWMEIENLERLKSEDKTVLKLVIVKAEGGLNDRISN